MPALLIGPEEQAKVCEVIAQAKANPLSRAQLEKCAVAPTAKHKIDLKDRPPGFERPPAPFVIFPVGYRAHYSVEEQPVGLYSHLSISVDGRREKGAMPGEHAVIMIAAAFNVPYPPDMGWIEEFAPGEYALNLVSPLVQP